MHGYEKFRDYLLDEGYRIIDENDTFFVFRSEGETFFVFKHPSSNVQVTQALGARKDVDRNKLLQLCNEMNDDKFIIKFVLQDDYVLCSAEFLVGDKVDHDFVEMMLPLLDHVSDEFMVKMSEL